VKARTLLVDLGNTRLKWAWLNALGRPGRMHAAVHASAAAAERIDVKDFAALLPPLRAGDRVFAVSVATPVVRRRFVAAVRKTDAAAPRFATSSLRIAGLRSGYREPWRLGADRWVALAGARPLARDVLVVDAGTAVTIDLLDATGRHHGGCILPGSGLMTGSLLEGTGGIRRRAGSRSGNAAAAALRRGGAGRVFARSTREAVDAGAQLAIVAAIERAVVDAEERLGRRPQLLLTGGDAVRLARSLRIRHEIRPALVLEGLAGMFAAAHSPSPR
jgi:type III pantothenate kinase